MMHQRCPAADYDGWARAGASGWTWTDVAPRFREIEDSDDPRRDHLGRGGPMPLVNARSRRHSPVSDAFLAACRERGHPADVDLNGPELRGAGWIDFNIKNGRRFGSRAVRSPSELRAFVHRTAIPQWHVAGSCRMGSDAGAVIDPELRVHGTTNLRIADTSIMPTITSGHCHAAALMIAERATDFVRRDHGLAAAG